MNLYRRMAAGSATRSSISFENFDLAEQGVAVPVADETLTLDEAAINGEAEIITAAQETEELSQNLDQIQTANAVMDVAEQSAQVQEAIPNPDENHVMLSETTRDMAAAAVGDPDATINEGSESWVNRRISTEGFVDWIKKVWQNIKDIVARLVQKAKIMWKSWFNGCASLVKKAKELKDKVEKKKKDKAKEDKLPILGYGKTLAKSNGTFDHKQVEVAVSHIEGRKFKDEFDGFVKALEEVIPADSVFKDAKQEAIDDVKKTVEENFKKAIRAAVKKGAGLFDKSGYPQGAVGSIEVLDFGNKQVVAFYVNKSVMSISEKVNSFTARFETANDNFKTNFGKDDNAKLAALTKSQITGLCDKVEAIGKKLGDYFEKDTKAIDKKIGELRDKLSKAFDGAKDAEGNNAQQLLSGLSRLYTVSTQLLRSQMSEASFYVSTGQAVLAYATQHANNLENDEKD